MTWIARISIAILITFSLAALAGTGLFFNVSSSGLTLTISTVVPNHTYPAPGIKINTPGYSLANVGTECTDAGNGYCLFSVSNNTPKTISITGSTGQVDLTLCLNGTGTLSCQNYTVTVNNTPPPSTANITAIFGSSPNGIPPITSVSIGDNFYISYTQSGTGSNTVSATLPSGMSFASASNCTVSESAPTCGHVRYRTGMPDLIDDFQWFGYSDGSFQFEIHVIDSYYGALKNILSTCRLKLEFWDRQKKVKLHFNEDSISSFSELLAILSENDALFENICLDFKTHVNEIIVTPIAERLLPAQSNDAYLSGVGTLFAQPAGQSTSSNSEIQHQDGDNQLWFACR